MRYLAKTDFHYNLRNPRKSPPFSQDSPTARTRGAARVNALIIWRPADTLGDGRANAIYTNWGRFLMKDSTEPTASSAPEKDAPAAYARFLRELVVEIYAEVKGAVSGGGKADDQAGEQGGESDEERSERWRRVVPAVIVLDAAILVATRTKMAPYIYLSVGVGAFLLPLGIPASATLLGALGYTYAKHSDAVHNTARLIAEMRPVVEEQLTRADRERKLALLDEEQYVRRRKDIRRIFYRRLTQALQQDA